METLLCIRQIFTPTLVKTGGDIADDCRFERHAEISHAAKLFNIKRAMVSFERDAEMGICLMPTPQIRAHFRWLRNEMGLSRLGIEAHFLRYFPPVRAPGSDTLIWRISRLRLFDGVSRHFFDMSFAKARRRR